MKMMRLVFLLMMLLVMAQCRTNGDAAIASPVPTVTVTPHIGVSLITRAAPTTAVLQTTPVPLPTATVTPTATPIIYTVAEGDTLLGIAIQQLTTVEEIKALNPDVRAELLQIGQQLVLPAPAPPLAQGVAGTAVPIQAVVARFNSHLTPTGGLWLLGEVTNQGDLPIINVQAAIRLLDAAGSEVGSAVAWVASSIILPGESAPFGVLLNEAPDGFERPSVSVSGGATITDLGTWYTDMVVGETAVVYDDEYVQLNGQIQNSGSITATQISLVATFYDAEGNVTGYHIKQLNDPLRPSESMPFALAAAPIGGQAVDYNLTVQASQLEAEK